MKNLNADYPYQPQTTEIPTLLDLLHIAESAPRDAIVDLKVDEAGLPKYLSLDPIPGGIDDEECYEVTDLELLP